MSVGRKVHLLKEFEPNSLHARCGAWIFQSRPALTEPQFAWLPRRVQCSHCVRLWYPRNHVSSGTELHETTVEVIVLSLAWLGEAARATPHSQRGCHFIDGVCWCGGVSVTRDPDTGTRRISVTFGLREAPEQRRARHAMIVGMLRRPR